MTSLLPPSYNFRVAKRLHPEASPAVRPVPAKFAPAPLGHSPQHPTYRARAGAETGPGPPCRPLSPSRLLEPAPSPGPPYLVLPGCVAPQHFAPDRDFEGPVGQLRLRRLLLPPPAAHPPVAPPGPGLGRAGRAKGSRGLRLRVTARGAAAVAAVSAVRSFSALRVLSLSQAAGLYSLLLAGAAEGGAAPRCMPPRRCAHAANR